MKTVEFKECNITYAKNQPEYLPLRCHISRDGMVTSCWGLSLIERIKVVWSGKIYLQILTSNHTSNYTLQPLKMMANNPLRLKRISLFWNRFSRKR